jgi:hypothetical protein
MTFRKWAVRVAYLAGGVVVSLVLVTFLAVQIQQRTLRWRAERLLVEMHQIRLHQSTWADTQRLMYRWGAWGHYDGICTAESCKYRISMTDLSGFDPDTPRHVWVNWLLLHDRFNLYYWFGGRGAKFVASFTVQDGTIWRETSGIAVVAATRRVRTADYFDKTLIVDTKSRQRLRQTNYDWWIMGVDDDLAQHPYYKAGRPGGCKINCEEAVVTYSTHTPPAEIERLTSLDFSCLTRFKACTELEQLLPAAKEWHLYQEVELDPLTQKQKPLPKKPCDIPVWALARDARYVLAVEALSTNERDLDSTRETAQVRVISSLKDSAPWPSGAVVKAYPFSGSDYPPFEEAEHLIPGKRFIVFPVGNDRRDQVVSKDSPITLDRCGVQLDTPETRRELEKGFAQNDTLNP